MKLLSPFLVRWCIACCAIIAGSRCLPGIDAFRIPRNTGCGTGRGVPASIARHRRGVTPCFPQQPVPVGRRSIESSLFDKRQREEEDEQGQVEVGTKEYYGGFLSSPIQDETVAERGSGLEQALKLGGGVVVVLVVLVLGFMASNGLI